MNYRPEVDGLRAIAILPVIFFHAGFPGFSGGYVGVDVFFVISGYLITRIIHQEMLEQRFSIQRFYERRARRLLPALFVVSLTCVPFAWLWMLPDELSSFSRSLVGVATFSSNIIFWLESGYFDAAGELKPLLHTWSLAVEEQYYVLYPLVLLTLYRWGPSRMLLLVGVGVVASLGLAQHALRSDPAAGFYLLPTRAWELGVGALAALLLHQVRLPRPGAIVAGGAAFLRMLREIAGLAGLGLIGCAVFVFDESTPFPSLWALVPVLGTALIILSAGSDTIAGRLLSLRLLVGIGLISYSAYLWHQPLFAFTRLRVPGAVPLWIEWVLVAATLVLAWMTWRCIETPLRRDVGLSSGWTLGVAAASCTLLAAIGGMGWVTQGHTARNALAMEFAAWRNDKSPFLERCNTPDSPQTACVLGAEGPSEFYLWGDSHGIELAWQLSDVLSDSDTGVVQLTYPGCQPTIGIQRAENERCSEHNAAVFQFLTTEAEPGTVILTARWTLNANGSRFDNREGGIEFGAPATVYPDGWNGGSEQSRLSGIGEAVNKTVSGLLQVGHTVVLVYPIPEVGWDVPYHLARLSLFGEEPSNPLSTSHSVYLERSANARAYLDAIPDNNRLLRVRPATLFCDTILPARCIAQLPDGRPLYRDDDHPNSVGAGMIADTIVQALAAEGLITGQNPEYQAITTGDRDQSGERQ